MNINMAGQTINDRLLAARHSLAGQGLAKSVCKATTEEMIGPKKKHLDYLVHCTNEPNVSIPHLANLLVERSQNANWVVVYKALITAHHLLAYGNERFIQYLASSNSTFNLSNFLDKGGVQGVGARIDVGTKDLGYDMSPFIRRYAKYLNEKAMSYRTVAFDFCKMKRGKEEGTIRSMNAEKLLKTLPVLQGQLDALLEFDCSANDLTNGVISMCFTLLFRDLIRLFACYNDGIINMLEKYFDMNKKQCREALDLYKRFLVRMDRVGEFLKVAENIGMDKGELPDLTKAPSSLLDALEGHLGALEGKKGSAANTPTQSASNQRNIKSGVSALSSTSSSFGTAAASTKFENTSNGIDDAVKAQALAEEEAMMNQFKQSKVVSPSAVNPSTNPFLASPTAGSSAPIVDLFDAPVQEARAMPSTNAKASDDLLQLGNPFADMFGSSSSATVTAAPPNQMTNQMWMGNGAGAGMNGSSSNAFVSDSSFSSVFGNTEPSAGSAVEPPNPFLGLDTIGAGQIVTGEQASQFASSDSSAGHGKSALDDLNESIRQAMTVRSTSPGGVSSSPAKQIGGGGGFDALGDVLIPGGMPSTTGAAHSAALPAGGGAAQHPSMATQQPGKVLTGDLDSSLASLAENLTINKSASAQVKGVQWNSPKNTAKPANWNPQPIAATTGAGYRPMAQGMTVTPAPSTFYPSYPQHFQQGMSQVRPQPMMPVAMAAQPGIGVPMMQTTQNPQGVQLDPFGAL